MSLKWLGASGHISEDEMARLSIDIYDFYDEEGNPDSPFRQTAGGEFIDETGLEICSEYHLVFADFTITMSPSEAVQLCRELRSHLIMNGHSDLCAELTSSQIEFGR